MLSQWFLPTENVTENDIMHCLDDIAETVKQHLPEDLASKYNQGKCLDGTIEILYQILYFVYGCFGKIMWEM